MCMFLEFGSKPECSNDSKKQNLLQMESLKGQYRICVLTFYGLTMQTDVNHMIFMLLISPQGRKDHLNNIAVCFSIWRARLNYSFEFAAALSRRVQYISCTI